MILCVIVPLYNVSTYVSINLVEEKEKNRLQSASISPRPKFMRNLTVLLSSNLH